MLNSPLKDTTDEAIHVYLYTCLKTIEDGQFTENFLSQIVEKIDPHTLSDPHPKSVLHHMLLSAIELIQTNYHGCSDVKAQRYLTFLENTLPHIHLMPPKVTYFLKSLVSNIKRSMLK